jgi:hypothetical protein
LRCLAACLALLLAGSSLGQIAHFLVVPHAICEEHGELVEVSAHAGHDAAAERHDDTPASAPSEEAPTHDHCELLASDQRHVAVPIAALIAVVPAAPSPLLALPLARPARVSRLTLALAPKTSPPSLSAELRASS